MRTFRTLVQTTVFRWTMSIAIGFTGMAIALFGFIYWQTAVYERLRIDGLITREAVYIASNPPSAAADALNVWITEDLHRVRYAGLFTADGTRAGGNLIDVPDGLTVDGQTHRAVFLRIDRDHDGDPPEIVRAVALRLADGQLLVLGYDIDELEDVQTIIMRALSLGLLPTLALSLGAGLVLARRAQSRIASFQEAVDRIMGGQLGERLPLRGSGDDMDRLAGAVNRMLQEIERLVLEIRGIGDNIAHDLRTPLTRVRTRLERGREEAQTRNAFQECIDRTIVSVDQALAVFSAILRISEIEHGQRKAAFAVVDLADIATDAFELYEPLAEEKGLALQLNLAPPSLIVGDRDLLLEAVGNLLDNALKFAPAGTTVTLSVKGTAERASLSIEDCGPGIPRSERARVLGRFYRGERSRTVDGNGLGLNLVSAIVTLHGFDFIIHDSYSGCTVAIDCPLAITAQHFRISKTSNDLLSIAKRPHG